VTLQRLALSRATLDRAAHRRSDPALVARLLADPMTAVLVLHGDRAPVHDRSGIRLALVDPGTAARLVSPAGASTVPPSTGDDGDFSPGASSSGEFSPGEFSSGEFSPGGDAGAAPVVTAFLGEDPSGRAYLLLARPCPPHKPLPTRAPAGTSAVTSTSTGTSAVTSTSTVTSAEVSAPDADDASLAPVPAAPAGTRWADLRAVGHLLDDTDAGLLTCGVALVNWHAGHARCARCGAATEPVEAGWARSCASCGAEHFPRTDPAVIMAVVDRADRILLGRQARWPQRHFSTLAGFVEPGEPLEAAVRREVAEEAGVIVGDVVYRGSQPWPFPLSLMLGFRASALSTEITVDGSELAQARWWTREELALDLATGDLLLPPSVSIARRLIEDWYGAPLQEGGSGR
jgi:NAD+ diphosphatase